MNVLFLSCGQGLSLAARLSQEGHNVKTFIHNDQANTVCGNSSTTLATVHIGPSRGPKVSEIRFQ